MNVLSSAIQPTIQATVKPSGVPLQRSRGVGRLSVCSAKRNNKISTNVSTLYQEGCAKIRLPKTYTSTAEAIMINSSGGMTGGDVLSWQFVAEKNANLVVTTQACERVYKSDSGAAIMNVSLEVKKNARLCWLPQETILFDRGELKRKLDVNLAKGAKALILESIVFGRKAMGEVVEWGSIHDRWRVRYDNKLLHAEDFRLNGTINDAINMDAVTGGKIAVATLLCISPETEFLLEKVRTIIGINGGASFWQVGDSGKLLARVIASDSYELRRILVPLIALLNENTTVPKVWSL